MDDKTLFETAGLNRKTALGYEQLLLNLMVIDRMPSARSIQGKQPYTLPLLESRSSGAIGSSSFFVSYILGLAVTQEK